MRIEDAEPFNDPEVREEYNGWLDDIYASADADIACEEFTHFYNETAKMLSGGLI